MSLVLLAVILFLNSLLAPHRRLVAEARTVATEFSDGSSEETDEGQFLLSTFQDIVQRLKEKNVSYPRAINSKRPARTRARLWRATSSTA